LFVHVLFPLKLLRESIDAEDGGFMTEEDAGAGRTTPTMVQLRPIMKA
jgi:hypothetical protein